VERVRYGDLKHGDVFKLPNDGIVIARVDIGLTYLSTGIQVNIEDSSMIYNSMVIRYPNATLFLGGKP